MQLAAFLNGKALVAGISNANSTLPNACALSDVRSLERTLVFALEHTAPHARE